jgi:eukaryotic-like serine/threonine-protein kinase
MALPRAIWDRWAEVDGLFAAALERPPGERRAFVEAAAPDPQLHAALLTLLDAEAASDGFLDTPGPAVTRLALDELARADRPGSIGRYTVLDELGRGGMGTVYLGVLDGDGFRQQVAIKVLRRGLDTDDIVRRFVTERRILASLHHPHIARLIDGGATDDGRPYLVMEYVEGLPITTYCDRLQRSVRERLAVVLDVCDAVSAAHTRLVVHRDLKPSNILIDARGEAKLLDFGIAKLLAPEEGAIHTVAGAELLTPEHASPEQLRGEEITTASDVYQLGVLLFELLTGQRPFPTTRSSPRSLQHAERHDVARLVAALPADERAARAVADARRTTIPQLRRTLRGDLDTIVHKALQFDPERRYPSAEQLAADVRRLLAGRAISARPDTVAYRTRLFLRRHPWVAPVAVALVALVAAYGFTAERHARQLQAERNAATLQAERAQEVQRFLVGLFRSADPYAPADPELGRRVTVVEALDVGAARLAESLRDRPAIRASILDAIAEVYANLGAYDRARPLREEALALQRSLYGDGSLEARTSLRHMAFLLFVLGEHEAGLALQEQALALALAAEAPPAEVATLRVHLGLQLLGMSRHAAAEPHLHAVVAAARDQTVALSDLAEAYRALSDVYRMLDRQDDAEQAARQALPLKQQALGPDSVGAALARVTLAQALATRGRLDEAEEQYEQALPVLEQRLGDEHRLSLVTLNNFALLRRQAGDLEGAAAQQRRQIDVGRRVHGERHHLVGDYVQNLATTLVQMGRLDEARQLHEEAAAIYAESLPPDNYLRAFPYLSLSAIHLRQQSLGAAETAARRALAMLERTLGAGHFATEVARCRLAQALAGRGREGDAAPLFDQAAAALMSTGSVPQYRRECVEAAAAFHDATGRPVDAAKLRAALRERS